MSLFWDELQYSVLCQKIFLDHLRKKFLHQVKHNFLI